MCVEIILNVKIVLFNYEKYHLNFVKLTKLENIKYTIPTQLQICNLEVYILGIFYMLKFKLKKS